MKTSMQLYTIEYVFLKKSRKGSAPDYRREAHGLSRTDVLDEIQGTMSGMRISDNKQVVLWIRNSTIDSLGIYITIDVLQDNPIRRVQIAGKSATLSDDYDILTAFHQYLFQANYLCYNSDVRNNIQADTAKLAKEAGMTRVPSLIYGGEFVT